MNNLQSQLSRRLPLTALLGMYVLLGFGLQGAIADFLSIPIDCELAASIDSDQLRQWMAGTFMAQLALGFLNRNVLLLWIAPDCSLFAPERRGMRYVIVDGSVVIGLILLTMLAPNAIIYASAAPVIPVLCGIGLAWWLERQNDGDLGWRKIAFGFEIAFIMWVGAVHAGSLASRCSG